VTITGTNVSAATSVTIGARAAAQRVDLVPMRADIAVFERDVIGAARLPSIVTASA
jgi:hypothetical protein